MKHVKPLILGFVFVALSSALAAGQDEAMPLSPNDSATVESLKTEQKNWESEAKQLKKRIAKLRKLQSEIDNSEFLEKCEEELGHVRTAIERMGGLGAATAPHALALGEELADIERLDLADEDQEAELKANRLKQLAKSLDEHGEQLKEHIVAVIAAKLPRQEATVLWKSLRDDLKSQLQAVRTTCNSMASGQQCLNAVNVVLRHFHKIVNDLLTSPPTRYTWSESLDGSLCQRAVSLLAPVIDMGKVDASTLDKAQHKLAMLDQLLNIFGEHLARLGDPLERELDVRALQRLSELALKDRAKFDEYLQQSLDKTAQQGRASEERLQALQSEVTKLEKAAQQEKNKLNEARDELSSLSEKDIKPIEKRLAELRKEIESLNGKKSGEITVTFTREDAIKVSGAEQLFAEFELLLRPMLLESLAQTLREYSLVYWKDKQSKPLLPNLRVRVNLISHKVVGGGWFRKKSHQFRGLMSAEISSLERKIEVHSDPFSLDISERGQVLRSSDYQEIVDTFLNSYLREQAEKFAEDSYSDKLLSRLQSTCEGMLAQTAAAELKAKEIRQKVAN